MTLLIDVLSYAVRFWVCWINKKILQTKNRTYLPIKYKNNAYLPIEHKKYLGTSQ